MSSDKIEFERKCCEDRNRKRLAAKKRYAKLRQDPEWRKRVNELSSERFHRKMEILAATRIFQCAECGLDFRPTIGRQKYCRVDCKQAHSRRMSLESSKTKPNKIRRNQFLRRKIVENQAFRIKKLAHYSIMRSLTKTVESRRSKYVRALPYSIPQLKAHIESQFNNENNFTWNNYGTTWEIDHIVPQALFQFDSIDSKAFRDCWALSNLRPLARRSNLLKGASTTA